MIIGIGLAAPTLAVPWLSGCTPSEPAADGPSLASGTPTTATSNPPGSPTPSATAAAPHPAAEAAAPEQAMAALAAAILVGPHRKELSKDRQQLLTFLRNAHTAHARAITNPLPRAAPAKIGGMSLNSSLALLARREGSAAARYRSAALKAKGSEALLLGSLSAAAGSFAAAIGSATRPARAPSLIESRSKFSPRMLRSPNWCANCTQSCTATSWRSANSRCSASNARKLSVSCSPTASSATA